MTADQIAQYTLWTSVAASAAAVFSCLVNIALTRLTASYVKLTHDTLLETKAAREPAVYFDIEFPDSRINVVVGNSGPSPAKNCRLQVVRNTSDIQTFMGEDLSSIAPFQHGIAFLAPKRVYKYGIGHIYDVGQKPDQVLHVRFTFENQQGKVFTEEAIIDMAQFSGVLFESFRDPSYAVAQAIESAEQNRQTDKMFDFSGTGPETVPCPICREPVLPQARKCKHCMEPISNGSLTEQHSAA